METKLFIFMFQEPQPGFGVIKIQCTKEEMNTIEKILFWLNEHGDDYTCEWSDVEVGKTLSYKEALEEIRLQSRYNETDTPGEYYLARCSDLEKQ